MGKVYLAHDPVLQRQVAIKVISIDKRLPLVVRDEYLGRFTLEARASAKLSHQSIVAVYDAGEENGVPWIAFEYIDGEHLSAIVKRLKLLPVEMAVSYALDLGSSLEHAHDHGIIHRDIKPDNVIIEQTTGIAKLLDFGIAKAPWAGLTQEGIMVGSPGYMSPEQINGNTLDGRTDLFSLGIVLYYMLSGTHPFIRSTIEETVYATLNGTFTPLNEIIHSLNPAVTSVVNKCLVVDRNKRLHSASEFIEELTAAEIVPLHQALKAGKRSTKLTRRFITERRFSKLKRAASELYTELCDGSRIIFSWFSRTWNSFFQPEAPQRAHSSEQPTTLSSRSAGLKPHVQSNTSAAISIMRKIVQAMAEVIQRSLQYSAKYYRTFNRLSTPVKRTIIISVIAGVLIIPALWLGTETFSITILRNRVKQGDLMQALEAARQLQTRKIAWPYEALVNRCERHMRQENMELASMVASALIDLQPSMPYGYILSARIALRSSDYDKAWELLANVKKTKDGKRILIREHAKLLNEIQQELKRESAPQSLINTATLLLSKADEALVTGWMGDRSYWLRWNAARIMQAGKKAVDKVALYILDFKYGTDTQVRINAANKLGELGDRRAIPVLQDADSQSGHDPDLVEAIHNALVSLSN